MIDNNDTGKLFLEMTCFLVKPHEQSRCRRIVSNAKTRFRNASMRNGEYLAQYPKTPSCGETNDFHHR